MAWLIGIILSVIKLAIVSMLYPGAKAISDQLTQGGVDSSSA
jgi:hypothetical protein